MKRSSLRLAVLGFLLGAAMLTATSCNKGYGCPSDFSIDTAISAVIPG